MKRAVKPKSQQKFHFENQLKIIKKFPNLFHRFDVQQLTTRSRPLYFQMPITYSYYYRKLYGRVVELFDEKKKKTVDE